jgi:hypothetical protein
MGYFNPESSPEYGQSAGGEGDVMGEIRFESQLVFLHSKITNAHRMCCALVCLMASVAPAHSQSKNAVFMVPGSTETEGTSINEDGAIAGAYRTSDGIWDGFVRALDGTITTFATGDTTWPYSINRKGVIAGCYNANTEDRGFVRDVGGTLTYYEVGDDSTCGFSINDKGIIVGRAGSDSFFRSPDGRITTFDPPGSIGSEAMSINNRDVIAGNFEDPAFVYHGYLRMSNGTFTIFDAPEDEISPMSINDSGEVTGVYRSSRDDQYHGFVRFVDGTINTFDPVGSIATAPIGVNNKGTVTGWYEDGKYLTHGFVRSVDGMIETFDITGTDGTSPSAINNHGEITGSCPFGLASTAGFLRGP